MGQIKIALEFFVSQVWKVGCVGGTEYGNKKSKKLSDKNVNNRGYCC